MKHGEVFATKLFQEYQDGWLAHQVKEDRDQGPFLLQYQAFFSTRQKANEQAYQNHQTRYELRLY